MRVVPGAACALVVAAPLVITPLLVETASAQVGELQKQSVVQINATSVKGEDRLGSGFVARVDSTGAMIVTAKHVIAGAARIEVRFRKWPGRPFSGSTIDTNSNDDLALIWCEGEALAQLPALPLYDAETCPAGAGVWVVGHPRDAQTKWAVQPLRFIGWKDGLLSLEGTVSGGFSGGPIIDAESRVIGIITASTRRGRSNYGTALPAERIRLYVQTEVSSLPRVAVLIEDAYDSVSLEAAYDDVQVMLEELGVTVVEESDAELVLKLTIRRPRRSVKRAEETFTHTVRVDVGAQLLRADTDEKLLVVTETGKDLEYHDERPQDDEGDPAAAADNGIHKVFEKLSAYLRGG